MGADGHRLEVQNENFFSDPGEISNRQIPRQMDIDPRLENYSPADTRAKAAQDVTFES
jgi:hypothetical protein